MIRINLLPHREIKRAARQRQFNFLAGGVVTLGLLTALLIHSLIAGKISAQAERNHFLEKHITQLNKEIASIKKLKEQIQVMLARKQVVEKLQGNRAVEVHLLDQLARRLPPGVYLRSIRQQNNVITLAGYAESNARVSNLMRNLDASPWLQAPKLIEIKSATVNNLRTSAFALTVKLAVPGQKSQGR
ncbi:MAG TPA: fimbrial protein [Betaproteobacteria bacterium]|nr:fimbrial protein [Betaproteobacteria bacterium]